MTIFTNMGIEAPDVGDSDYPATVTVSFQKIDGHDHSSGKGVLIPAAGIAANAVTTAKILDANVTAAKILDSNITTTKIADANVTRAKLVSVGQQISESSGSFVTSSTSPVDVTNLSVTITTTGRPVMLFLQGNGNVDSSVFLEGTIQTSCRVSFVRGATTICRGNVATNSSSGDATIGVPPGSFTHLDVIAAGTYTYKVQAMMTLGQHLYVTQCRLVAYEL